MSYQKIKNNSLLIGVAIPILIIVIWEILVKINVFPYQSIAPPSKSFIKFFKLIVDDYLWRNIGYSIYRLFAGFILGSIAGIYLGWLVGYYKIASKMLEPSILTFIPVPPMAWIPFLIVIAGIGETSKILLISIGAFSVLFISTSEGVRNTDRKLLEMASVFNKTRKEITRSIVFPSVLKFILANLRIATALSFTLLIAAEMIDSYSGLGWLINDARRFSRAEELIVGIFIIGILGKSIDYLIVKLSGYFLRWDSTLRTEN